MGSDPPPEALHSRCMAVRSTQPRPIGIIPRRRLFQATISRWHRFGGSPLIDRSPDPPLYDPSVSATNPLSNREARWLALAAQGLGTDRKPGSAKPPEERRLRRLLDQVATIQLDAVNVVARTQFLVPFSRIGSYDRATLLGLTGPGGQWFEYWGHAASLLPTDLYPLFRWKMDRGNNDLVERSPVQQRRRQWREANASYLATVLLDVTERGPLAGSQLSDPRRRSGEWWERRSDGRRALEVLFQDGELAAWRSPTFERIYDLTERVIPQTALDMPVPPPEEAQRELIAIAARCMGVATVADLADYFWIRPGQARRRVAELVEAGRLVPVTVENWSQPAYAESQARPRAPQRQNASLLSPFDSLIWFRDRTTRLFDFHYRIEIYVPEHRRIHGYYVMPLLVNDALVARFDLKADRSAGTLRVNGSYLEKGVVPESILDAAAAELRALSHWLGLEGVSVAARGNLARGLRKAMAAGNSK